MMTEETKKIIRGHLIGCIDYAIDKCTKLTEGTICTSTDLELKMECWTPKKGAINPVTYYYGKKDLISIMKKKRDRPPRIWASALFNLFNKEMIDL